ncbi:hypothetical protein CRV24_007893 [Beauveria bassiana]|nr:hypothetical protein CRV24_007893 [Beauveria bassiana]
MQKAVYDENSSHAKKAPQIAERFLLFKSHCLLFNKSHQRQQLHKPSTASLYLKYLIMMARRRNDQTYFSSIYKMYSGHDQHLASIATGMRGCQTMCVSVAAKDLM